jgi:hypothetical protein
MLRIVSVAVRGVARVARLAFAGLDIVAMCVAITDTTGSLVNFFSFFTIESNLLAIVVLLIGGVFDPQSQRWRTSAARRRCIW